MDVQVRLFGLGEVVAESEVWLTLPPEARLGDVVEELVKKYGSRLRPWLIKGNGRLQDSIKVLMGDQAMESLDQELAPGQSIFFIHQIAGGSK